MVVDTSYKKKLKNILSRPTIIKLASFNTDDIDNLLNNTNLKIRTGVAGEIFNSNALIIQFLFNILYINVSGFTDIKPLAPFKDENIVLTINRDTEKFKQITNSIKAPADISPTSTSFENNSQYIYIKNWLQIINTSKVKDMVAALSSQHDFVFTSYYAIGMDLLNILEDKVNDQLQSQLDKILKEKVENNILTYIKIRNDDFIDYNRKRFKILINQNKQQMLVKYNDNNTKYTDKDVSVETKTYPHTYALGPFSQIFIPCFSNKIIADKMNEVVDKLEKGDSVFTYGYGASGAGKTSSLIYFNKGKSQEEKDGVLIHICNRMTKYDSILIKIREFYRENDQNSFIEKTNGYLNFQKKSKGFVLENDYIHTIMFPYRFKLKETYQKYISDNIDIDVDGGKISFKKGTSLGELLIILIDLDRFVKATTNNPNSSRSHILTYIRFKNGPLFIVGDFAGVENKFKCDDNEILNAFTNVKIDNSNNAFYSIYNDEINNNPAWGENLEFDSILKSGKTSVEEIHDFLQNKYKNKYKDELQFITNTMIMKNFIQYDDFVKRYDFLKTINTTFKKQNRITHEEIMKALGNYKPKLSGIERSINANKVESIEKGKFLKILADVDYIINLNNQKNNYAKNVCEIRKNEGVFINESLNDINGVIKYILMEKNKDATDISPEFIDKCLPAYCSDKGCFFFDKNIEDKSDSSIIFSDIKNELGDDKLFKNLSIAVFCVFNISKSANNPPPIPYIDINQVWNYIKSLSDDLNNYTRENAIILRNMMYDLKLKFQLYKEVTTELYNYIYDTDESGFPELRKVGDYDQIRKEFKKVPDETKYIKESFEKYTISNNYVGFFEKCKKFLMAVDKSNAASAIGTLHTVDNLAKYNTVNVICDNQYLNEKDMITDDEYKKTVECQI